MHFKQEKTTQVYDVIQINDYQEQYGTLYIIQWLYLEYLFCTHSSGNKFAVVEVTLIGSIDVNSTKRFQYSKKSSNN